MKGHKYFRIAFLIIFTAAAQFLFNGKSYCDYKIIADHNGAKDFMLRDVPKEWLDKAKSDLHIGYGHTSHGSQITSGMTGMVAFINRGGLGFMVPAEYPTNYFSWNNGGTNGALDLQEGDGYGTGDLDHDCGYYPNWVNETRTYLDNPANNDVNVIIWSWCGQLADYTQQRTINEYLAPMAQLELDYPNVKFVYMTCHLNGTGITGNLHQRNEQIRQFCRDNNKILYDFTDIESYDPDGARNYNALYADDNCDYDADGQLPRTETNNWAIDWQNSHTVNYDWYSCSAAHSQALNGNLKAYAAWYLFARLAGWDGDTSPDPGIPGDVNNDGAVNVKDLIMVAINYGQPDYDPNCDLNEDGKIDIRDLLIVAVHYGDV